MSICFFVLEAVGVIAFAISGMFTAAKSNMDIFGACMLGMITAVGGGIMRDVTLGIFPPTALHKPWAALLAIAVSFLCFIPSMKKFRSERLSKACSVLVSAADSVGLAVFTVTGVNTARIALPEANVFTMLFAGTVTAIGGGIVRDILSESKPLVFVNDFYACASILGALIYIMLLRYNVIIAFTAEMILVLLVRFFAIRFHWRLFHVKDIAESYRR